MKFISTKIKDLKIIQSDPFADNRGYLQRSFCKNEMTNSQISFEIKQSNISFNKKARTLRGFHYQVEPFAEKKIITCLTGSIHNIVIDLRKKSKTYLKWQSFKMSSTNKVSILVPEMCANAYLSLEDNTTILYFHSQFYNPKCSKTFHYNSKTLNLDWPLLPEVISHKDNNSPDILEIV